MEKCQLLGNECKAYDIHKTTGKCRIFSTYTGYIKKGLETNATGRIINEQKRRSIKCRRMYMYVVTRETIHIDI